MFKRAALLVILCFFATCHYAQAWDIEDYKIAIKMEKDSSIEVTEVIDADFGFESKHGIFRDLPTAYQDEKGRPYKIRFDVTGVRDQEQRPWPFSQENNGNFKRIKIGSPNETVSGRQTYVISYRVSGVILFQDNYDELYWNAVGTQWDVPIHHVHVSVHLPQPIPKESLKTAAYTGFLGSKTGNARTEFVGEDVITFEGENYAPHEGFTIDVAVPKGILIKPPTPAYVNSSGDPVIGPVALVVPAVVLLIVGGIWGAFGKDPVVNKSIVVEYKAPEDLKPVEIGAMTDRSVDQRDITASIIDLAVRGYIKIVQSKGLLWQKDYTLVMLKPYENDGGLKSFERLLLRSLFDTGISPSEVKMSELRDKFYRKVGAIENEVKDGLAVRKYWGGERAGVVMTYFVISAFLFGIGLVSLVVDQWIALSLILTSIIIFLFGLIMPKRTTEAATVLSRIMGFKEFLQRTDKDQIQKAEQQDIFERMLPYAICLGMSTTWAKKFDGLYAQPPQWFSGDYGSVFIYNHFIHDLDRSVNTMGSAFYSQPQTVSSSGGFSSGGGFSGGGGSIGGGFGGGGGGSW